MISFLWVCLNIKHHPRSRPRQVRDVRKKKKTVSWNLKLYQKLLHANFIHPRIFFSQEAEKPHHPYRDGHSPPPRLHPYHHHHDSWRHSYHSYNFLEASTSLIIAREKIWCPRLNFHAAHLSSFGVIVTSPSATSATSADPPVTSSQSWQTEHQRISRHQQYQRASECKPLDKMIDIENNLSLEWSTRRDDKVVSAGR